MIKTKIIQLIIMSTFTGLIFVFGAIYASGTMGVVTSETSLTVEGKLGAGLISVGIMIWLWTFVIAIQPLFKWKNKSSGLSTVVWSSLFLFPLTMIYGIAYIAKHMFKDEHLEIKEATDGSK